MTPVKRTADEMEHKERGNKRFSIDIKIASSFEVGWDGAEQEPFFGKGWMRMYVRPGGGLALVLNLICIQIA
jgi:hypothetical protein